MNRRDALKVGVAGGLSMLGLGAGTVVAQGTSDVPADLDCCCAAEPAGYVWTFTDGGGTVVACGTGHFDCDGTFRGEN